ncbi:hypothetical protein [Streptomyces cyaneofuscatus]|uniref:hypothetical protein n=1 Tax=Streptomyces cyaneofuscatus TaxID=66883 RepID=UPI0034300BFA
MLTDVRSARVKSRKELVATALAALFVAVVYSLAVWARFGQETENALLWPDNAAPAPPLGSAPVAAARAPGDRP